MTDDECEAVVGMRIGTGYDIQLWASIIPKKIFQ
jgi:hypothetical protein